MLLDIFLQNIHIHVCDTNVTRLFNKIFCEFVIVSCLGGRYLAIIISTADNDLPGSKIHVREGF